MKFCILVAMNDQSLVDTLYNLYNEYKYNMQIFLYNDGVLLLNNPSFLELTKRLRTTLCSVSADERNIRKQENVFWGSLYDLSTMISNADRLISFTREA
ncbi:MAG: DsrE family protein [bacterium]